MSSIPVLQELEQLVSKYADVSTPIDILRAFAHRAKLEEANIVLHERMARDVYTIFGKSEDGEMSSETGKKLLSSSTVTSYHHANSVLVFHTEAEVEFNMNSDKQSSGKRKRDSKSSTALDEPVIIKYQFSEQTLGAGSGTSPGSAKREKGVTVLEAPYKSINLIITMRRGHAGLEQSTVVDFQLLTSGCSPSAQRITLQELMGKDGGEAGSEGECGGDEGSEGGCEEDMEEHDDEGEAGSGSEGGGREQEEEEDSGSEGDEGHNDGDSDEEGEEEDECGGGSDGEDESESGIDTADYYNVNVCTDSLAKLKLWLGFKSLQEQQDEEEEEEARLAEEEARLKASKGKGNGKGSKTAPAGKKQKQQAPPTPEQSEEEESEGGSESERDEEEEEEDYGAGPGEPSAYELDPALADLLQFLLSLPYVDEAWGIHDLILDHELGANDVEEEEEEGSEDEEEYCLPCCQ